MNTRATSLQSGQTLIETMVAIFILTTGITAAVGLAIYALSTSTNASKQIIATGLAREGIEAVKNMRDTNWLQDTLVTGCFSFVSGLNDADCYTHWLNKNTPFCLDPTNNNGSNCNGGGTAMDYSLGIDPTSSGFWNFKRQPNSNDFGLSFDPTNTAGKGFYSPGSGVNCSSSNSGYCRKVIILISTPHPFDEDPSMPLVTVKSRVWWKDKKCSGIDDWDESVGKIPPVACRIELQTFLTNWKNY